MRRHIFWLVVTAVIAVTVSSSRASRADRQPRSPFLSTTGFGQHAGHAHGNSAALTLSKAVDGATAPEAISDDLAYTHFFVALATRPTDDTDVIDRFLQKAGIAHPVDRTTIAVAMDGLRRELALIESNGRNASQKQSPEQAREQKRKAIATIRGQLDAQLSANSRSELQKYIRDRVKRRIVIYRGS